MMPFTHLLAQTAICPNLHTLVLQSPLSCLLNDDVRHVVFSVQDVYSVVNEPDTRLIAPFKSDWVESPEKCLAASLVAASSSHILTQSKYYFYVIL